jgi:hypothetical protein
MSAGGRGGAAGGDVANYMLMSVPQLKAACASLNIHMPSNASETILQHLLKNHYDTVALNAQRDHIQSLQQRQDALQPSEDANLEDAEMDSVLLDIRFCTICYCEYNNSPAELPRLLPCGHTFGCTSCLDDFYRLSVPDCANPTIFCPVCSKLHFMPRPSGIDVVAFRESSFPIDFCVKEVEFSVTTLPFECTDSVADV